MKTKFNSQTFLQLLYACAKTCFDEPSFLFAISGFSNAEKILYNLVECFSSVKFPFDHFFWRTSGFYQIRAWWSDSNRKPHYAKLFYLIILFFILQPFTSETFFARPMEIPVKVTPCQIVLGKFTYDKKIKCSWSHFQFLKIRRKSLGEFRIGGSELLSIVPILTNKKFDEFPTKNAKDSTEGDVNSWVKFKKQIKHEPVAFDILVLLITYWLIDKLWKIGEFIWYRFHR